MGGCGEPALWLAPGSALPRISGHTIIAHEYAVAHFGVASEHIDRHNPPCIQMIDTTHFKNLFTDMIDSVVARYSPHSYNSSAQVSDP
jgi:hypothetical protein